MEIVYNLDSRKENKVHQRVFSSTSTENFFSNEETGNTLGVPGASFHPNKRASSTQNVPKRVWNFYEVDNKG